MKFHVIRRRCLAIVLSLLVTLHCLQAPHASAASSSTTTIIILTKYSASLSVGEEFYLGAVVSTAKLPTFKSSDSKVASVSTYGRVTAKQAGSCRITARSL
jgi:uncharacterized protein YjdB